MIEIGIPFSDPMADGIVIQNAATRALHNGMSLRLLFEQLRDIRRDVRIPSSLWGTSIPSCSSASKPFARSAWNAASTVSSFPTSLSAITKRVTKPSPRSMTSVSSCSLPRNQRSPRPRNRRPHRRLHLSGVQCRHHRCPERLRPRKQAYFKKIEDMNLRNPRMVGFGISNKQTFDAACAHSSGAIIGSRFVTLLNEKEGDAEKAIRQLKEDLKQ